MGAFVEATVGIGASVEGTTPIDPVVRVAVTTSERLAAFRLRYEVYIAEQGKPYPEANHEDRLLSDDLDAESDLIVVKISDRIIGTVRGTWFESSTAIARYGHVFELFRFPEFQMPEMGFCSRLAASMDHRHKRARELLFESIYERGLDRHTRLCFATCAPMLLRMFRKYGFREYLPPIHDPVVGQLHRTVLVLDDVAHLERMQSPFLPIANTRAVVPQERAWLTKLFDDYKARHAESK